MNTGYMNNGWPTACNTTLQSSQIFPPKNLKPKNFHFLKVCFSFMGFDDGKLVRNLPETLAILNTCQRVQIK